MSSASLDPLGAGAKHHIIATHLQTYGLKTMVETGLYNGRGSGMAMVELGLVEHYYVIDFDPLNVERARQVPGTVAICADSGDHLPRLLEQLDGPALFWLDAHAWVGEEFGDTPPPSPLLAELEAITNWGHADRSVVLVDDMRQMRFQPLAQPGWPSLGQVTIAAQDTWNQVCLLDVIRLTPKEKPHIGEASQSSGKEVSDGAKHMTPTMYDASTTNSQTEVTT